jgi:hypothetical protein
METAIIIWIIGVLFTSGATYEQVKNAGISKPLRLLIDIHLLNIILFWPVYLGSMWYAMQNTQKD